MEDAWEFVLLGLIRENNFVWGGGGLVGTSKTLEMKF